MKALRIMIPLVVFVAVAAGAAGCGGHDQKGVASAETTAGAMAADKTSASAVQLQERCPVMGGKVDRSLFVDANGKRIYVCCAGCLPKLKQDPAKYIGELEAQGITLDKTPPDKQ